ncbi:epithelial-stromal interaction protein 1 [Stegastes partitus]|uniref:Epithelial-stromal interaction protein 1 n=1 Tax=Stegastes partitus TaxID=144197 RepID=A0A9Y4TP40_9TELE|nr:PREDICTED: epithelial-stromal interaction protein 1-like [Stegastes partitus]
MDPHSAKNQLNSSLDSDQKGADVSGNNQTPGNVDKTTTDSRNPQQANRQPQYLGGFTLIPPNEARRTELTTIAKKGEENLQRWKEANRPSAVHLNPERLGGHVTESEARVKQLTDHRNSKLQKKLKQMDLDKKKRQEEDEKLQKMKDQQREKAERQEQRRQQEEQQRSEQLRQDRLRSTEAFLQRFQRGAAAASSSATHTSSRGEDVESKQREKELKRSEREVQLEHQRVNSDFLDKLQGRGKGSETKKEAERPYVAEEDFKQETTTGHFSHLKVGQSCSAWTEEAALEPDYDWALMKLKNRFPQCSVGFLEDILHQCNGDYEEASTLLICSLS